jgi:DNA-directed RNA polymerase subunit RPC12/RpoP
MRERIEFRCAACASPLRAPIRLAGQACSCPGCGEAVLVPVRPPAEGPPMLVMDDGFSSSRNSMR